MASIVFMKTPIDEFKTHSPTSLERDADASKFGLNLYDFYMKDFAHLTIDATINLWGSLRGVEVEASK